MSTKRLCIFLLIAPTLIGVAIWCLTITGALHPTLRGWALASNLLAWLPVPGTVGDILTLDYPRKSAERRALFTGASLALVLLSSNFLL